MAVSQDHHRVDDSLRAVGEGTARVSGGDDSNAVRRRRPFHVAWTSVVVIAVEADPQIDAT